MASVRSRHEILDEDGWGYDGNTSEGMQYQQIIVTGYDQICPAFDGEFEELVVGRVAAYRNFFRYGDQLRCGEYVS
jgi:hypothetical protein